jgi:crotonobetainyl-CoA:carnitine CoA-transferase CaiB-like acyl-CoA transferase
VRHRTGSRRLVVFQGFETKNGPIIIAAGNDRLFAKLAAVLGRPEWATDPRFATNADRIRNRDELIPEVEQIVLTRTKGEWIDRLEEVGVPCAPIHAMDEALAHPQTAATGMIQPVPELDFELMGLPLSFDGRRPGIRRAPPKLGEHTEEILPATGSALGSPTRAGGGSAGEKGAAR